MEQEDQPLQGLEEMELMDAVDLIQRVSFEDLKSLTPSRCKQLFTWFRENGLEISRRKAESYRDALWRNFYVQDDHAHEQDSPTGNQQDESLEDQANGSTAAVDQDRSEFADLKKLVRRLGKRVREQESHISELTRARKSRGIMDSLREGVQALTGSTPLPRRHDLTGDTDEEDERQPPPGQPQRENPRPQLPLQLPRRQLRLNTVHREAGKIYADATAQAGTTSNYVATLPWQRKRNQREAANLARAVDFFGDQFGGQGFVETADGCEVLLRRLVAVILADSNGGDWNTATFLEESPEGVYVGSEDLYRRATKMAEAHRKLLPQPQPAARPRPGNKSPTDSPRPQPDPKIRFQPSPHGQQTPRSSLPNPQ